MRGLDGKALAATKSDRWAEVRDMRLDGNGDAHVVEVIYINMWWYTEYGLG